MPEQPSVMRLEIPDSTIKALQDAAAHKPDRSWFARLHDASGLLALVVSAAWILFTHCTVTSPKTQLDQRNGEVQLATQRLQLQRLEDTPVEILFQVGRAPIEGATASKSVIAASLILKNAGTGTVRIEKTSFEAFLLHARNLPSGSFAINRPGEEGPLDWEQPVLKRDFSLDGKSTGRGGTAVLQAGEHSQTTELYGLDAVLGDWIGVQVTITVGDRKRTVFQMMQLGMDGTVKYEMGHENVKPYFEFPERPIIKG